MNILALETATSICSVAISSGGSLYCERKEGRGIHSEAMFQMIHDLLARCSLTVSDLDAVLVSRGPGQYTGLRIAASGVKGLLFGQRVPLWSIGTLEGFSMAGISADGEASPVVHSVLDARRRHLYHQMFTFQKGQWVRTNPLVRPIEELEEEMAPGSRIVGTGISRLSFPGSRHPERIPETELSASLIVSAWQRAPFREWFREEDPERFEPEYLGSGAPRRSG